MNNLPEDFEERLKFFCSLMDDDDDWEWFNDLETDFERFLISKYIRLIETTRKEHYDYAMSLHKSGTLETNYVTILELKNKEIEWYRANAPVKYHEL